MGLDVRCEMGFGTWVETDEYYESVGLEFIAERYSKDVGDEMLVVLRETYVKLLELRDGLDGLTTLDASNFDDLAIKIFKEKLRTQIGDKADDAEWHVHSSISC